MSRKYSYGLIREWVSKRCSVLFHSGRLLWWDMIFKVSRWDIRFKFYVKKRRTCGDEKVTIPLSQKERKCVGKKNGNVWGARELKDWKADVEQGLVKVKSHSGGSPWISLSANFQIIKVYIWLIGYWPANILYSKFFYFFVCDHFHKLVRRIQLILTKKWNCCSMAHGRMGGWPLGVVARPGQHPLPGSLLGKALGMPKLRGLRLP